MPLKLVPPREGKTTYWSVRGTHLGVYVNRSTKLADKAKAGKLLIKWREEIERGEFAKPGAPTFLSAALAYIRSGGDSRFLGQYDPDTGRWSKGLISHFWDTPLVQIDQARIDAAAQALHPTATAQTRNRQVYTPASAVLKHAGVEFSIRRPKGWRGSKRTFWLWQEKAFAIFKAADGIDPEFGIFLRTLCYTGMRLGEGCSLPADTVSLREGFAYLPDSKNEEPRAIFLPPVLVAALANHPRGLDRPGETVFRFRKNGRLYTLLGKTLDKARVVFPERSGFHAFCHTYATWMRRYAGLDTDGLVETGRWKDRASAARYTHVEVSEASRKAMLLPTENTMATGGESVEIPSQGRKTVANQ